ncbi:MAG: DUF58 domain-containing protein [Myxococcota bacterium]|nr:DUF58 domain-containing protein [Myxococcota bacterium]
MDRPRDPRRRRGPALIQALRRALRPPRSLRPTRAGWVFFLLVFAVGFAAMNTGNNLLYLVLSLMLAFLALSGVLSESALRGIQVERRLPFELVAGRPARVRLEIGNAQRRVAAHAIAVEDLVRGDDARVRPAGRVVALRVAPGEVEERAYQFEPERRGPLELVGFRVSTRFPFGLFTKALSIEREARALVYPPLGDEPAPRPRSASRRPGETDGQRGAPNEVTGLRDFAPGDSPRRVHWRASWRRAELVVRDAAGQDCAEAEVVLRTRDVEPGAGFEASVARAASQVHAALRAGMRVALRTDAEDLPAGLGGAHRARLLGHLALVRPEPGEPAPTP